MQALSSAFWRAIDSVVGSTAAYGLRMLGAQSPTKLVQRSARLWQVTRGMVRGGVETELPVRLQVETTDVCNLKCRMCAREELDGLDSTTMSFDAFRSLVDQVKPFFVTLNGLGEPLIDKTIFEKLDLLHARGIMSSMPTNGSFMFGPRLEKLLKSFPDVLTLSLDGATKESYEFVRKLANFEKVMGNAQALLARRNKGDGRPGEVRVLYALQKANLFDFGEMFQLLRKIGTKNFWLVPVFEAYGVSELVPSKDEVHRAVEQIETKISASNDVEEINFLRHWSDQVKSWLVEQTVDWRNNRHSCTVPWYSSYVDAKGRVYPCCYLLTTDHVMGNVNDKGFEEVWNGETYRDFRHKMLTDRPNLKGCNTCGKNDDSFLKTLGTYRWMLLLGKQAPQPQSPTPKKQPVRLPLYPAEDAR